MTIHVSAEQVRWWLDDDVVHDVTRHSEEGTDFNIEVRLSRLPIHIIKETEQGPLRLVGRSAFDTERARSLVNDEADRQRLLERLGPMLVMTSGFYIFLDGDGDACEFRNVDTLQVEHRLYPSGASQQALMDGLMEIATGMRYVQNVVAAMRPNMEESGDDSESSDE